jgi:predicted HicB family RNase H-like nuclease
MNKLTYNGYTARIDFDDRDNIFVGRLLGIKDVIAFHADNVSDLREAFIEAVDDYLETCTAIGKSPDKTVSGKLLLRLSPDIHAAAQIKAQSLGKSLNQFASEVLSNAVTA